MEKEQKEKIRLTTREILLRFCDGLNKIQEIFGYSWHKEQAWQYQQWRDIDQNNYYNKLWKLEKQGYIKRYKNDKKNIIKLTSLGEKRALKYLSNEFEINKPLKWDKKWRMVIFDIPEEKKVLREIIRERLQRLGFYQLQKSIFVYPFECEKIISAIKYIYPVGKYLLYIVAESIETEIDLVSHFYDQEVLDTKP